MKIYYILLGDKPDFMTMPFEINGEKSIEIDCSDEDYEKALSPEWDKSFADGQLTFTENTIIADAEAASQQKHDELQVLKAKMLDGTSTDDDIKSALIKLINGN